MKYSLTHLLLAADLLGTFLFALEGGSAAIAGNLDLLGLLVVSFSTALGGGIIRDLLIGATPPNAIKDWRYGAVAFAGAAVFFFLSNVVQGIDPTVMMVLDAAGLSLFAVSGAGKALSFGIHPFIAILLGTITGVGGGTIRDLFLARIPAVLRTDIYAVPAMAGSAVMVIGLRLKGSPRAMAFAGGFVSFLIRVTAVFRHWQLPGAVLK